MFANIKTYIEEKKREALLRDEHWTKAALRPIAKAIMYKQVPDPNSFPVRPGWKQFRIGKVNRPPHSETEHTFAVGAPGTGKSVCISDHLDQIRAYGQPAIVFDPTGEFVEWYYRDGQDIILSPFDSRAASWNLFGELKYAFDITNIAEALVEAPATGEKFWANNARILFSDLVRCLDQKGMKTNESLYFWANEVSLESLYNLLRGTHGGELVNPESAKTAIGIRSELGSTMLAWPFLGDSQNPFSLREFIRNCDDPSAPTYDRWVFLSSRGDAHSLMKPLISLWLEIVCSGILSLTPNAERRIHLVIDELPSLQKLPSLETLMAQGRKFGVCSFLAIQLFPQLVHTYGRDKAEAMFGVSGTIISFRTGEPTTAEFMSRVLGNYEIDEKQSNRSVSVEESRDSVSFLSQKRKSEAFLPGEILHLPKGAGIIKMPDMPLVMFRIVPKDRPVIAPGYVLRPDLSWEVLIDAADKLAHSKAAWADKPRDGNEPEVDADGRVDLLNEWMER